MPTERLRVDLTQALARALFFAALILALADLAAGAILGVTDVSIPRVGWALAYAGWAWWEWKQGKARLLWLLITAGVVTVAGSLATLTRSLPFGWYDTFTTYGILMAIGVATAVVARQPLWLRVGVWAVPTLWALSYGSILGYEIDDVVDWAIVTGLSVAILRFLVRRLYEAANAATEAQATMTALHRALAGCSRILLADASDEALGRAMGVLLEATDAHSVFVDRTIYGEEVPGYEVVAGAYRHGIPEDTAWMRGSYSDLPTMLAAHQAGQIADMRLSRLDGSERDLYTRGGIEAELSVPVTVDDEWRGCLSLVYTDTARDWTDQELEMLIQAAGLVSAYWRRRDDLRRLEELVRSKDELVAAVSHELRTPLTAVVGLAEEMASSVEDFDPGLVAELATVVAEQSRELADLVEDLLVAARVESGALTIRPTRFTVMEEVRSVASAISPADVAVSGWDGEVDADPLRCRQIVRNLITNAVRYGGPNIEVVVERHDDEVVIAIRDDGVGVPPDEEDAIFEAYYRSRTFVPGSVGIGLAVSRKLAGLMGGSLVYRRQDGVTEFRLALPRTASVSAEVTRPALTS